MARLERGAEGAADRAKLLQPPFEITQPALDQRLHLLTWVESPVLEIEKSPHVVEGEAIGLRGSDEQKSLEGSVRVVPVVPS